MISSRPSKVPATLQDQFEFLASLSKEEAYTSLLACIEKLPVRPFMALHHSLFLLHIHYRLIPMLLWFPALGQSGHHGYMMLNISLLTSTPPLSRLRTSSNG
jgi:hypothetical protein